MAEYAPGQWGDLTATRHDDGRITLEGDSEYVGFSTYMLADHDSRILVSDGHIVVDAEGDWRFEIVAFESQGRVVVGRRITCPDSPASPDA
jgi:hypothetical protein